MADVVVRPAGPGDLARLLDLYVILAEDNASAVPADALTAETVLARVLDDDAARHLVVAEVAREVCGTADLLIVENITHAGSPWAIVENVVVAPDRRRSGVATSMMRHLISVAREHGCYKVQLLSGKQRDGAHRMYRSVGFEAVAEGFKLYLQE